MTTEKAVEEMQRTIYCYPIVLDSNREEIVGWHIEYYTCISSYIYFGELEDAKEKVKQKLKNWDCDWIFQVSDTNHNDNFIVVLK